MRPRVLTVAVWLLAVCLYQPRIAYSQSKSDCLACHSDNSISMERGGEEHSLFVDESILQRSPHARLTCIACHTGFSADDIPHKDKIGPVECLTCHKDAGVRHSFHPQIRRAIVAREAPDPSCKDCHGAHDVVSSKVSSSRYHPFNLGASCGECHGDVHETFGESAHGKALVANVIGAPNCLTCHRQDITIRGDTSITLAHKVNQEKLCLSCHLDNPDVRARTSPTAGFIAAYEQSVHGSALLEGNAGAANCVDCHGSHKMKKGLEPSATVHKIHVAETCSHCHGEIAKDFGESVHGVAVQKGIMDAPTCTNCHGEHTILKHTDPRSPVAPLNLSQQVCSPCHSSLALSAKYGLRTDRFKTFSDSYHGLALRGGSLEVANCASCHGSHNIKPSSDPTSTIYKGNLATTCGKCHPGANERFAMGAVHVTMAEEEEPILYWISTAYIIVIVVVIGGMLVHNSLDFIKKSKRKLRVREGLLQEATHDHGLYLRMTVSERIQHGVLLVSFVVLVITGFMLRFPDVWWVKTIRNVIDQAFDLRSLIHRIAAVVMISAAVYHLYYVMFTTRGRTLLRDLRPKVQDIRDALGVVKYNIGLSKYKPEFGRFSYIEKSEYWALIWGTIVMSVTGFVMWFDNTFIGLLTKLGYDISRTVHYYEAWLATLAVIVWHFYYVIFNPDVYPINFAFWKGTLTEAEMEEDHPRELRQIKQKAMEEERQRRKQSEDTPLSQMDSVIGKLDVKEPKYDRPSE